MQFKQVIEIIRDLSNKHRLVRSFHTGLDSQHNEGNIDYPAVRLAFPYRATVNNDEELITYTFKMSLLVNSLEEEVASGYEMEVNTNYLMEDDTTDEICSPLTDETLMREKAIRMMLSLIHI